MRQKLQLHQSLRLSGKMQMAGKFLAFPLDFNQAPIALDALSTLAI